MKISCTKEEKEYLKKAMYNLDDCIFEDISCTDRDCEDCYEEFIEWEITGEE